ncbi:MAG: lipocalin-like domain-containing protein [Candidatus Nanoarchaeia archaeon]
MEKRVILPADEFPHYDQAIEWWYFNGFLEGKSKYAFMTCLFKANKDKVNLKFLKIPVKNIYFSHSLLFNLTTGKIEKEVLPFVIVSEDSFKREDLFINYFSPIRKNFYNYEISRNEDLLRIKTSYFDLQAKSKKVPLLEGGKGFIELGPKSTYYFSYPNLQAEGYIGKEFVKGKIWHDKQWSEQGFMKDAWLWFSIQLPNNTEIVCFDYKGKKMASILYPNNKQIEAPVTFKPLGKKWVSKKTKLKYHLEWEIKINEFVIKTKPLLKECEMNFGFLNYWEGPIEVNVNGVKAQGFMEYLAEGKPSRLLNLIKNEENSILKTLKLTK